MSKRNKRIVLRQKKQRQQQWFMIGGIGAILLAVAGVAVFLSLTDTPEVAEARLNQEAIRGTKDAPVQIIEYASYGCQACRAVHHNGILDNIIERYGDRVELVFRNAPIIGPNDRIAAEAAQCALDQGDAAFWTFHNALYDLSDSAFEEYSDKKDYVELAGEIGLDSSSLQACLDHKTHRRTVDHWYEASRRANVNGTPTFFVNGRRLNSPTDLQSAVETALGL